ncbi:rhomboid family intramembrane serine protease [Bacteroidia bacterium]|nr:rhomboid family intramembrane serine protease [Bacteroidia bacterium]
MNFNFNRSGAFGSLPVMTKNILLINGVIWLAAWLFPERMFNLSSMFGLHYVQARDFHWYQLATSMFVQEEFMHLFFNMFALYMFGRIVEETWGGRHFLFYYMVCGIGAGLTQELVAYCQIPSYMDFLSPGTPIQFLYDRLPVTIGASGAVFGVLLAFGMLYPNMPLYLMFVPVPVKAKYVIIGYGVLELIFGMQNSPTDNVAHFAHLGGMLFGLLLILYWRRRSRGNIHRYK